MASDQTKVLNTIAKYNYNTFIHTHKKIKLHTNSTCTNSVTSLLHLNYILNYPI